MLTSSLDSHPGIVCLGEIFRLDRPVSECTNTLKIIRRLAGLRNEKPMQIDKYVRNNTMQFFTGVLARNRQLEAFGCKVFRPHHPEFIHDISRDENACIIRLNRENILAAYSSQLIANATGKHTLKAGDRKNSSVRMMVDFSDDEFDAYRRRIKRSDTKINELLQGARCKMLDIEYTDLLRPGTFRKVLEFLSVNQDFDIKPRTVKVNSNNIMLRFRNPDVVAQYLEKEGLTSWAEEC